MGISHVDIYRIVRMIGTTVCYREDCRNVGSGVRLFGGVLTGVLFDMGHAEAILKFKIRGMYGDEVVGGFRLGEVGLKFKDADDGQMEGIIDEVGFMVLSFLAPGSEELGMFDYGPPCRRR